MGDSGARTALAVVDRIESGIAVCLVGEAETEWCIPLSQLPITPEPGCWYRISYHCDDEGHWALERMAPAPEVSADRLRQVRSLRAQLLARGRKGGSR